MPGVIGVLAAAGSVGLVRLLRSRFRRLPRRAQVLLSLVGWAAEYLVLITAINLITGGVPAGTLAELDASHRLLAQGSSTLAAVGSLAVLDWGWGFPSLAAVGLAWAGQRRRYVLPDVLVGLGLGALAPGLLVLVGVLGGWDHLVGLHPAHPSFSGLLLDGAVYLAIVVFEELLARGWLLAVPARAMGIPAALLISTVLFGLGHVGNPDFGPAALGGHTLAGLVFAWGLLRSGLLWLPLALHFSFDWAYSSLYGLPNTGVPVTPLLRVAIDSAAPTWATGGTYGPLASVTIVPVLLVVAAAIWLHTRGRSGTRLLFPAGAPERRGAPAHVAVSGHVEP